MKCGKTWMLILVAMVLAAPSASADGPSLPLAYNSLTGGYAFPNYGADAGLGRPGAYPGLINGPVVAGNPYGGRMGVEFAGPTMVESFTIAQTNADGRRMIRLLDVYADGVYAGTIQLKNPYDPLEGFANPWDAQTVYFADFGITNLQATWLTLVVPPTSSSNPSQYGTGDVNGGPISYSFGGQAYVPPVDPKDDPYHNLNRGIASSRLYAPNALGSGNSGSTNYAANRGKTVDGNLLSTGSSDLFWPRGVFPDFDAGLADAKEHSLTIDYNTSLGSNPQDIGSVGIALAGDKGRDTPKWVLISGGVGDEVYGEYKIMLDPVLIQYNRYTLNKQDASGKDIKDVDGNSIPLPLLGVEWLKITFPPSDGTSADSANWWIWGDPNFGLVEFQAFAPAIIPEPATMTLLALGGLAMLRRRCR